MLLGENSIILELNNFSHRVYYEWLDSKSLLLAAIFGFIITEHILIFLAAISL